MGIRSETPLPGSCLTPPMTSKDGRNVLWAAQAELKYTITLTLATWLRWDQCLGFWY